MAKSQIASLMVSILVPIATALIGILGVVFQDWRVSRTRAGRRKVALEDAKLQVAFTTEWLTARKLITDSPEALSDATTLALKWLQDASDQVAVSEAFAAIDKPRITVARLMLFYRLRGTWANILRVLFYIAIFFFLIGCIAIGGDVGTSFFGSDLAIILIGAGLMLVFRFGAAGAEHERSGSRTT